MECNKYSITKNRRPYKALQIVNRGQYLSVRVVIYTLEAENKRLISQTGFSLYRPNNQKMWMNLLWNIILALNSIGC